jgi:hypothetical protein
MGCSLPTTIKSTEGEFIAEDCRGLFDDLSSNFLGLNPEIRSNVCFPKVADNGGDVSITTLMHLIRHLQGSKRNPNRLYISFLRDCQAALCSHGMLLFFQFFFH